MSSHQSEPFRKYWRQEIVLYRGEDVVETGTIKQIAERRDILKSTVNWYTTAAGHRRADSRKDQAKATRAVRV